MRALMIAAMAALAGCQAAERNMSMANGLLRVEPHQIHADSVRIVTIITADGLDPLGRGTPAGNRNVVRAVLGDQCADAPIIDEGHVRQKSGRIDVALRVVCPAARR